MSQTTNSEEKVLTAPVPKCKTPKRLDNLAADALACHMLPDIMLPLRKLFAGRIYAPLDDLKALKTRYWSDMRLGSYDSKVRQLMSRSFIDALDYKYGEFSFKATRGFAVQLLFCCEAGHLQSMEHWMVDPSYCSQVIKLVQFMAPLHITVLHDTCLSFGKPAFVLGYIMQSSPYLTMINLRQNLCDYVLWNIGSKCTRVQVLKIDVNLPVAYVDEFAKGLCLAFFNGLTSDQVREKFQRGEPVPITFRNLQHLHVRYDVLPGSVLIPFFECVLNCYHSMTIEVGNCIAWPFTEWNFLKEPLLSPSLLIDHKQSGKKRAMMYFWSRQQAEWQSITEGSCTNFHACSDFLNRSLELLDQLHGSFYSVKELKYVHCRNTTPYFTVNIHESFGATLKELFLYGVINDGSDLGSLLENLNKCPNLQTLYLSVVLRFLDEITDLKPLSNLQTLSVNFNSVDREKDTEITEEKEYLKLFLPLLRAVPNLQMLEMPGSTCLSDITSAGLLSNLQCLSLRCFRSLSSYDLMLNLSRLPNLKVLIINQGFGYIRYVSLKRMLRYTDQQVIFNKERLVES